MKRKPLSVVVSNIEAVADAWVNDHPDSEWTICTPERTPHQQLRMLDPKQDQVVFLIVSTWPDQQDQKTLDWLWHSVLHILQRIPEEFLPI